MKTLRIFLQFLFVVANVVAVVLLIVSAYSDRVSPETSMTLSYLGLAFPVLCVVNLCFIIYWLFLWEWKFLLIGIFSFLLCWGPVKRYFPFHSHKDVPREEVLKVLTYNVMAFGYKNHTKIAPNKIIQYIANSDADIVCLQEYATAKSEKSLTASKIYDALSMYPYRSVFYQSSTKFQSFGIAVFSKYPLSNSRMVKYDSDYNGSSVHEVNIKGKKLTLINNHLESFKLTMEEFYATAVDADYLIYNGTIDGQVNSISELEAKNELFSEFKAVKDGNVWYTGKNLYQATDTVGELIKDMHLMLTDGDESQMIFLEKME
jgi:endonuclease/exonuclease/phosphatase (EEP) superfamily protein YafD